MKFYSEHASLKSLQDSYANKNDRQIYIYVPDNLQTMTN